jgi:integrase
MPLKELEVRFVKSRKRPFKLSDGGGLHLLVQPNGSKLWRLKYRFDGRERLLSFGKYPVTSLAIARAKRDEAKALLAGGVDPGAVRHEKAGDQRAQNFEAIARAWHANREAGLNVAHAKRVMSRMERDVFPIIGNRPIVEIKAPDVLALIRRVEARGALDISRRLKQGIGQVFRFAVASGWADSDPTVHLFGALKPKPRVQHMARVPLQELPALVGAIGDYDGEATPRRREITRAALMFTLLTWARTSETRFATWAEFEGLDGPNPLWRIPRERMKTHREHLVPLSHQVVAILRARRAAANSDHVFPGTKLGQPISENTMIYACYRMGYLRRQTVHGFRGLSSTWANEAQTYKSDWIEMALAHTDDDEVRGAYNSALYLLPRRRMLQDWADLIDRASFLGDATVDIADEAVAIPSPVPEPVTVGAGVKGLPARSRRQPYWQQSAKTIPKQRPGCLAGPSTNCE